MKRKPLTSDESEKWREEIQEHQRQHFAVKCGPDDFNARGRQCDMFRLDVTHNGTQWQSIALYPEEIDKVIGELKRAKKAGL